MSPELLQHGRLTKLNDVYSFAMLLIELWSSKRLFQGLSQQQARPRSTSRACEHALSYLPSHDLSGVCHACKVPLPCSKSACVLMHMRVPLLMWADFPAHFS